MVARIGLTALLTLLMGLAPVHAAHRVVQFPLTGVGGYQAAKGMVTFTETVGSTVRDDGWSLVIEVDNVPLPPNTELRVFVHEVEVGTLKLNKKRMGRLVLETGSGKRAPPRIKTGSSIVLKLEDGSKVIW